MVIIKKAGNAISVDCTHMRNLLPHISSPNNCYPIHLINSFLTR